MRVLLVTGSSGGHIFPALALMDHLKESSADVLLVLPKNNNKDNKVLVQTDRIKYIAASNLGFGLGSKNIKGLCSFLIGAWEGLSIMIKFRPDVVVGFGSLNTIALLFWAWLFRVKTIIHEQNVIPGRANRLLAKLVDKVALSFSQTNSYLNIAREKVVLTGNPMRKDLVRLERKEALDFFKFKEGAFTILITGGSQGSHKLNAVCLAALSAIQEKNDLQVVHISGTQDFTLLKQSYEETGITHRIFDFLSAMQYAYSVADLVICRAGATTIAELQKFSLPALLVPYPFAYKHQLNNARILENLGAALIMPDDELSADKLRDKLQEFLKNPQKLTAMRQAYAKIPVVDALKLLSDEVLSLN